MLKTVHAFDYFHICIHVPFHGECSNTIRRSFWPLLCASITYGNLVFLKTQSITSNDSLPTWNLYAIGYTSCSDCSKKNLSSFFRIAGSNARFINVKLTHSYFLPYCTSASFSFGTKISGPPLHFEALTYKCK